MSQNSDPVPWNDGLLGPALEIAAETQSPLRVMAGPGTGKTYSMMRRVARLLQEGVDPSRVMVCTFTRTAATDLKKALASLNALGADRVRANTIHSYCFSLLSRTGVIEATGRVPRPLLEFEYTFLMEDLKREGMGGSRECSKMIKAFEAAWARLQSDDPGWPQEQRDQRFHNALLNWLRFHRAMLIGELVVEGLTFLRNNPESLEQDQFNHILVDEYQDLNRADQALIDRLTARASLTVIGDENQSIYAFRYAHPEGVTNFATDHPGTIDRALVDCRRCPSVVIALANSLKANNINRADRPIRPTESSLPGQVYLVQWNSMAVEAEGMANFIKHEITAGRVQAGKVLVLSPRRQIGYNMRRALQSIGVAAHSFFHEEQLEGEPRSLADSLRLQAFSLLNLLASPDDAVSLRVWCGFGSQTLNSAGWMRVRRHCLDQNLTPRDTLKALLHGSISLPFTGDIVGRYRELEERLEQLATLRGKELIDSIFPEAEDWAKSLRDLSLSMEEEEWDPPTLLDHLRSNITQPELPTEVDYVRVMSLHKSKGLTADLVVILGTIEGLIPTVESGLGTIELERSIEEQRRLFYVGITRTTKTLAISSVSTLPRDQAHKMRARLLGVNPSYGSTLASRFIRELGEHCPPTISGADFVNSYSGR